MRYGHMEEIIVNMINKAYEEKDYDLIEYVKKLIRILSLTCNAPRNWRNLGEILEDRYNNNDWVYDNLELWEYVDC